MMGMIDQTKLLRAFWHTGRRSFVPLTPAEVARKCEVSIYGIGNALAAMKNRGIMESVAYGGDCGRRSTWHLTPRGESMVRSMMGASGPLADTAPADRLGIAKSNVSRIVSHGRREAAE